MQAIRNRLTWNLVVQHPVTPNETITNGTDDARARFFRDRLSDAIETLTPLFEANCTRKVALKCWDQVFATTFFGDRSEVAVTAAASLLRAVSAVPVPAVGPFTFPNVPRVDDKPRGFG
jgi:hypothetical protein